MEGSINPKKPVFLDFLLRHTLYGRWCGAWYDEACEGGFTVVLSFNSKRLQHPHNHSKAKVDMKMSVLL